MPHYASASQRVGRRNSRTRHNRETHLRSLRQRMRASRCSTTALRSVDGCAGRSRLRAFLTVVRTGDGCTQRKWLCATASVVRSLSGCAKFPEERFFSQIRLPADL